MASSPQQPATSSKTYPSMAMDFEYFSLVDVGRVRQNNEDAVAVDERVGLLVLADGMGGYNAGEVASGMATTFLKVELSRWLAEAEHEASDDDIRRAMEICTENANRAIFVTANAERQYAGMGTTLVLVVIRPSGRALVGHVGDSRAYRFRSGELRQITKDHSLLQEQLDAGIITPEQAAFSVNKNLVTRAVGVDDVVELDVSPHDLLPGDTLLMCSDGLSDMLSDADMTQILQQTGDLSQIGQALVDAANAAGGRDNISVILVRVGAPQGARGRSWYTFGRS